MSVFNLMMTLLLLTGGGLITFTYLKLTVLNSTFKEYLFSIGDKETVKRIGGWRTHPIIEIEIIMEDRYEQTKNIGYLSYCEQYSKLVKRMRIYLILMFVLMILCTYYFQNSW